MRIRLRHPSGSSTITIAPSATVGDLLAQISSTTSIPHFEIKSGYPPQPLLLDGLEKTRPLAELDMRLDGEQLIISAKEVGGAKMGTAATSMSLAERQTSRSTAAPTEGTRFSFASVPGAKVPPAPEAPSKPLSLTRKSQADISSDPPEILLPDRGATLLLRIMPDDNSCMFRAVGSALIGSPIDSMTELRSLVAQTIQSQPDMYSAAVLDQPPDEYCRWIQTDYSWGGGIELSILSAHFDVEICSIDVQSLRVDRFNEGRPTRCLLVYSGIHYDVLALSPSGLGQAPPDLDTKVFDASDEDLLREAVKLCRRLQEKHYFIDTAGFSVKCNVCGTLLVGEKGAAEHASATGHADFGEAG
ncbi:MAG: ubiquitin-specific protease otu1 [Thelocarpon impressellum]|nr:MAG: ubiquitin-specific protease otu1 [Thelocarpon impressellum]